MAEPRSTPVGPDWPALCQHCGQGIRASASCLLERYDDFANAESRPRIANGDELRLRRPRRARCPDCGVDPAALHHPGCGNEECPGWGRRALSCDCVEPPSRRNVFSRGELSYLGSLGWVVQLARERLLEVVDRIEKPFNAGHVAEALNLPEAAIELLLAELIETGWLDRTPPPDEAW